jgi:gas vesicle protein
MGWQEGPYDFLPTQVFGREGPARAATNINKASGHWGQKGKKITMKNTITTIGLVVTGVGAGAAAALFFAPQSGKQTREDIGNFADRKLDQIGAVRENVVSYASDRIEQAKNVMGTCLGSAKTSVDGSVDLLIGALQDFRERVGHA